MDVTVFYDYTCPYSYKMFRWLSQVAPGRPDLRLAWRTFLIKEVNRAPGEGSLFDEKAEPSVSVLALALAHALRETEAGSSRALDGPGGPGGFATYHAGVFEAMHGEHRKVSARDLLEFAAGTGLDVEAFERERARWVRAAGEEHGEAASRWKVFGTPTLIIDGDEAVYLKFGAIPETEQAAVALWDALSHLARSYPEVIELKRP